MLRIYTFFQKYQAAREVDGKEGNQQENENAPPSRNLFWSHCFLVINPIGAPSSLSASAIPFSHRSESSLEGQQQNQLPSSDIVMTMPSATYNVQQQQQQHRHVIPQQHHQQYDLYSNIFYARGSTLVSSTHTQRQQQQHPPHVFPSGFVEQQQQRDQQQYQQQQQPQQYEQQQHRQQQQQQQHHQQQQQQQQQPQLQHLMLNYPIPPAPHSITKPQYPSPGEGVFQIYLLEFCPSQVSKWYGCKHSLKRAMDLRISVYFHQKYLFGSKSSGIFSEIRVRNNPSPVCRIYLV